jgi:hypothetical protein
VGLGGYFVPNPQDEYFDFYGGSARIRDSIGGKSTRALYERHDFPGRHIGASGWRRSVDANNSINRGRSGFAADCKGGADRRRNCCRL